MKRTIYPCEWGDALGRHRWRDRIQGYMPDGTPYFDRWCKRCGEWMTDVVVRPDDPKIV
jgi:hypothetical protein